jgi:hypothetical protein
VAELDEKAGGDRSGWVGTQIRQLLTLKANHEDVGLAAIDADMIRRMAEYWMGRPRRQGSDEPVAAATARRQWERLVALLRWVHRSKRYSWRMPADALEGIVFRAKKTAGDNAARVAALRQKTWTPAQLAIIYRHATPLVRAVMMFGLNCGYYGVDVATQIDSDDVIFLGRTHPHADYLLTGEPPELQGHWRRPRDWMLMLRLKTGVPGEWLLWAHTAAAIRWARERKRRLGLETEMLMPTEKGTAFNDPTEGGNRHDKLAKKWKAAWEMARKEDSSLPWRPLSSLRDTISDLVARKDDTASTLLVRHGQPFRGDSLLELYAGRPFLRVHTQLERIHGVLAPLWEADPHPFPDQEE